MKFIHAYILKEEVNIMLTFIQRIYKNQKKEYHLLLVILTFLASFEFTFLAMYDALRK